MLTTEIRTTRATDSVKAIPDTCKTFTYESSHMCDWGARGLRMQQTSAWANSEWRVVVDQTRLVVSHFQTDWISVCNDTSHFNRLFLSAANGFASQQQCGRAQSSAQCDKSNRQCNKRRQRRKPWSKMVLAVL